VDRIEILLAQLHAAALTVESLDESHGELAAEVRAALQDATVSAHRLRLQTCFRRNLRLA
jgi:hypothetical protein